MISNKIKPKVKKVIDKFPTYVDIYRHELNEFNEPNGDKFICSIKGFYHEGTSQITSVKADKGEIKRDKSKFLMVICDDITMQIQEDDFFILDHIKYSIKDLGNQNRLNIYFDMLLERC